MTTHRVRRRTREAVSTLEGIALHDRPKDVLNRIAPTPERCAWPGCRAPMDRGHRAQGQVVEHRYGVLCETHAVDVAIAVIQTQVQRNQVEQFFEWQSTERAVRAARWRREEEEHEAQKAALRQDRDGFVYYIRIGERIKIGYSVDVKRRMRAYPPGSRLLAVEPGDRELERSRHQQFAGSRSDGREWFRPTQDIAELVQELVDLYGEPKRFAHHYRKNEDPVKLRRTS